ncbi:MAG: hypothetical protein ACREVR_19860 [Burkholderiales bacterium]
MLEIRNEAREFREETRANFVQVFHRLNLIETRLALIEATLPRVVSQIADLQARVTALEQGR